MPYSAWHEVVDISQIEKNSCSWQNDCHHCLDCLQMVSCRMNVIPVNSSGDDSRLGNSKSRQLSRFSDSDSRFDSKWTIVVPPPAPPCSWLGKRAWRWGHGVTYDSLNHPGRSILIVSSYEGYDIGFDFQLCLVTLVGTFSGVTGLFDRSSH